MKLAINKSKLELVKGDITSQTTDAVVNAANSRLAGGGGVDGAIHRAGGPSIMEFCRMIGSCPTGKAVITPGGMLKSRYVIHAVGPVWRGGEHGEDKLLASAYRESLALASEHGLKTVAFPSLSTGAYGYPIEKASRIALCTVIEYLNGHPEVELVLFVLFSDADLRVYESALRDLLPR
jgi:O-acetyl-ADP-ribose deacetylase (regulator of RNase III)